MGSTQERPRGPKAITRVFDVLALLADKEEGMSLAELSATTAVPKSTFIDTLRGLCDMQYLACQDGRYRLGPAAYHFASRLLSSWSEPEMIRIQVKRLAESTRESVGYAIADWEIGQAIYTEAVNSTQPVRYAMQAGLRAPLYASAAGRVLLAFASPALTDRYLSHANIKQLTENTPIEPGKIRENLGRIRNQGYCASFGEMLSDTAAIAVPIQGPDGSNLGALMLAAPFDRMKLHFQCYLDAILEAGKQGSAGN